MPIVAAMYAMFAFTGNAQTGGIPVAPYITPTYTPLTNYYVAKSGSDSNNGSTNSPWLTISHALSVISGLGSTQGGVCINVGNGIYSESIYDTTVGGSANTPTGWLVFRSQNLHGATVQVPGPANATNYLGCFQFNNVSYIIVDGFNLVGMLITNSVEKGYFGERTSSSSPASHHLKVLNCVVYNHGGGGIAFQNADYVDVEGNVVYNCALYSEWEESGIGDVSAVASDTNSGFHNIIANNIAFNNEELYDGHTEHTDGNGIIIDSLRDDTTYGPYKFQTLVENNLSFSNGGGGVHVYYSDYVTARNNTAYHNYLDLLNTGTLRGDINACTASNCTFINNIAVSDPAEESYNTAYADAGASSSAPNLGNVYSNNLSFDGTAGQSSLLFSGTTATFTAANGNILGSDPMFVSSANDNFILEAASPAINAGTTNYGVPSMDLAGNTPASNGVVNMGAYEFFTVSTNLALLSSVNPSIYGGGVIFTATAQTNGATAGNATGSVLFSSNSGPLSRNDSA